ncbi:MAG: glycosyltransferase [Okeania sp. SIO2C9]|uniref:galactosyltransferase-related protein n=1 Tax=Okeania sp. SIO2C9 TaxID=2607791 RepID=UPI0013BEC7E1|nr:galactosyltransferase-related protein [Okeania sp. SIO2C9]NEQ75275.1 glycosyltransferase [Okeania sp. SIO2C9]
MFDLVIPIMKKKCIKHTLEYYSNQKLYLNKILLVDYLPEYTNSLLHKKYTIVNHIWLKYRKYFNKSFALNIGIDYATSHYIICCDADVLIDEVTLHKWDCYIRNYKDVFISLKTVKESESDEERPGYGIVCGTRNSFLSIEGYDSSYIGWGFEDLDILNRMYLFGKDIVRLGHGLHLSHDDEERMQNYATKSKQDSRTINLKRYENKKLSNNLYGTFSKDVKEAKLELI